MRFRLLFLPLICALVAENAEANTKINIGQILEIGIKFLLINLKRLGTVSLGEFTVNIPEEIKNISIGSASFKDAEIYGFETLDIQEITASDIDTGDDSYKISLSLKLRNEKQIGFSSNYNADIGIIDEIPVYGDGKLDLAVEQTVFDISFNININEDFSQFYVDNFMVYLELRDSNTLITGFWKNDNASEIVTAVVKILEKIIFMWMNYEKDCISCVISPVIEYVVNSILPNDKENDLVIDCSCLNNNDPEDIMGKLLISYHEGSIINLLTDSNHAYLRRIFRKLENIVLDVLSKEGFNIDL